MMDPVLEAAIRAGAKIVHLVTVNLPDHTIRWTDGGFVRWEEDAWAALDPTFGALDSIGEIVDGIEEDPEPVALTILPPDLECLADLAAADAQGGRATVHLGAVDPVTGLLVGDPYPLFIGVLDRPVLKPGPPRRLEYDILPVDAFGLIVSEEQRQTDAFHQMVWPGELGNEYATEGTKLTYWREDDPKNTLGVLTGRGILRERLQENKAIEFTYEPESPLAFPIGRCAVRGGAMRYRKGYGPTNRYMTYFSTVGASGPVQGLVSVEIDDEVTTFDAYGRSTNGAHETVLWFNFLPGDQPSAALPSPSGPDTVGDVPGWTADHKLSGRPGYAWTGKENSKKTEFGGGLTSVLVVMDGLYGWDPRTEEPLENRAAWPPITDGATAGLNWVIGRWEGASGGGTYGVPYACWIVGGIGAPFDGIDVDAFAAAADIADANGWTCAGAPYSDEDKTDVLDDLLKAAGAKRARICGKVSCVSFGAARESVRTVTGADAVAGTALETVLHPSILDRRNTGIGRFLSAENRYEITPIKAVSNAAWVTADGGRATTTCDFRFCPSADAAAQLTYLEVAYEREAVGEAPFMPWMLALEPGDAFDWAAPEFLLDGVKARVERRRYDPSTCRLRMQYRTETDSKYAEAMALTGTPPTPTDPESPPAKYVEPPTDFMISNEVSLVSISYRNPVSTAFDFVNMMRATDSTDFADAGPISFYAGAPGEYVTVEDTVPGVASYSYWPIAIDFEGNPSDPDQPGLPLIITV